MSTSPRPYTTHKIRSAVRYCFAVAIRSFVRNDTELRNMLCQEYEMPQRDYDAGDLFDRSQLPLAYSKNRYGVNGLIILTVSKPLPCASTSTLE